MKHLLLLLIATTTFNHAYSQWSELFLPEGRSEINSITIDDDIYFIGGAKGPLEHYMFMDVYNTVSEDWTSIELPFSTKGPRSIIINNDIYIGEVSGKRVGIYNLLNSEWSEIEAPGFIEEITHLDSLLIVLSFGDISLYNMNTGEWSEFDFQNSNRSTVVATNGKIVMAGGNDENVVRIYDVASETWTEAQLSIKRESPRGVAYNNKLYFIGGEAPGVDWQKRIDIYDVETNEWSIDSLSEARHRFDITLHKDKLYVAGGQRVSFSNQFRSRIDILNLTTNEWSILDMPTGRRFPSIAAWDSKLFIAGGDDEEYNLDLIEVYETPPLSVNEPKNFNIAISQNPVSSTLSLTFPNPIEQLYLIDISGKIVSRETVTTDEIEIDVEAFPAGIYYLRTNDVSVYGKFLKL